MDGPEDAEGGQDVAGEIESLAALLRERGGRQSRPNPLCKPSSLARQLWPGLKDVAPQEGGGPGGRGPFTRVTLTNYLRGERIKYRPSGRFGAALLAGLRELDEKWSRDDEPEAKTDGPRSGKSAKKIKRTLLPSLVDAYLESAVGQGALPSLSPTLAKTKDGIAKAIEGRGDAVKGRPGKAVLLRGPEVAGNMEVLRALFAGWRGRGGIRLKKGQKRALPVFAFKYDALGSAVLLKWVLAFLEGVPPERSGGGPHDPADLHESIKRLAPGRPAVVIIVDPPTAKSGAVAQAEFDRVIRLLDGLRRANHDTRILLVADLEDHAPDPYAGSALGDIEVFKAERPPLEWIIKRLDTSSRLDKWWNMAGRPAEVGRPALLLAATLAHRFGPRPRRDDGAFDREVAKAFGARGPDKAKAVEDALLALLWSGLDGLRSADLWLLTAAALVEEGLSEATIEKLDKLHRADRGAKASFFGGNKSDAPRHAAKRLHPMLSMGHAAERKDRHHRELHWIERPLRMAILRRVFRDAPDPHARGLAWRIALLMLEAGRKDMLENGGGHDTGAADRRRLLQAIWILQAIATPGGDGSRGPATDGLPYLFEGAEQPTGDQALRIAFDLWRHWLEGRSWRLLQHSDAPAVRLGLLLGFFNAGRPWEDPAEWSLPEDGWPVALSDKGPLAESERADLLLAVGVAALRAGKYDLFPRIRALADELLAPPRRGMDVPPLTAARIWRNLADAALIEGRDELPLRALACRFDVWCSKLSAPGWSDAAGIGPARAKLLMRRAHLVFLATDDPEAEKAERDWRRAEACAGAALPRAAAGRAGRLRMHMLLDRALARSDAKGAWKECDLGGGGIRGGLDLLRRLLSPPLEGDDRDFQEAQKLKDWNLRRLPDHPAERSGVLSDAARCEAARHRYDNAEIFLQRAERALQPFGVAVEARHEVQATAIGLRLEAAAVLHYGGRIRRLEEAGESSLRAPWPEGGVVPAEQRGDAAKLAAALCAWQRRAIEEFGASLGEAKGVYRAREGYLWAKLVALEWLVVKKPPDKDEARRITAALDDMESRGFLRSKHWTGAIWEALERVRARG